MRHIYRVAKSPPQMSTVSELKKGMRRKLKRIITTTGEVVVFSGLRQAFEKRSKIAERGHGARNNNNNGKA